ncbi:hypothetical protein KZ829_25205 [Actinoplanes hulinensis]|uniref:Uncharacterized protein n=2 Tax=Actinoplanes TaxID=1865 RepID=A0A7W5FEL2_9ACTN|nr:MULTISPECIES: hypothetical protein [Actinoplanes]MBB3095574.1 hypothetical protein [Actinoplanes campanulatus]MBW6437047.1 hypothetical protein [Actinoplanes hulinensis]GGN09957.1 hypothetical protein GCM10010109_19490 [Actinoplanes campanulatus]GID36467.1 hypothetical protein Aca09nite_29730 [Actinoplanes campanulatus]GID49689.1 hypothetical protein Aca07nite_69640 [Actinoplanes capillaceus]
MSTLSNRPGRRQESPDHRAGVIKTSLTVAGASAVGLTGIIGAAAYGAIPAGLAYSAVGAFALIMLCALGVVTVYIRRG